MKDTYLEPRSRSRYLILRRSPNHSLHKRHFPPLAIFIAHDLHAIRCMQGTASYSTGLPHLQNLFSLMAAFATRSAMGRSAQ